MAVTTARVVDQGKQQDGAIALSAILLSSVVLTVSFAIVMTVADIALTAGRAQSAADAAALAAAGATLMGPTPADPRRAAEIAAQAHGAVLVRCCGAWEVQPPAIRVTVRAQPSGFLTRRLRSGLQREAYASLRPPNTQKSHDLEG